MMRRLAPLAAIVSWLVGGAAPLEAGKSESKITYPDLISGGIAIGGVTSVFEDETSLRESREAMAQTFETYVLRRRKDVPLMVAARVRAAMGTAPYDSMLDDVQQTGEVTPPALAALRAALADSIRYLVVARLEKEEIKRHSSRKDPDDDPKTDNTEIVQTATRRVEVGFRVYDIRDGTRVWKTSLYGEESRSASALAEEPVFKSHTVAGKLVSLFGDEEGPNPELQGATGNLPRIFDEFAKRLPQKKK